MRSLIVSALTLSVISVFMAEAVAAHQLPRGVLLEARTALAEGRVDAALVELESLVERSRILPGWLFGTDTLGGQKVTRLLLLTNTCVG